LDIQIQGYKMAEVIDFTLEINGVQVAVKNVEDLEKAFNRAKNAFETGDLGGENLKKLEDNLNAVEKAAERAGNQVKNGADSAGEGALKASEKVNLLRESFDGAGTAAEILSGNSETVGRVVSTTMRAIGILNSAREVAENKVTAAILKRLGVERLQAAGTRILTTVQAAYNAVLLANPIGLVVAAVVALVGVFALLVNPIRNFISQFESLGDVVEVVGNKLRDIGSFLTFGLIDDAATAQAVRNIESVMEAYDDLASKGNQDINNQTRYINELKARGATAAEIYQAELRLIDLKIVREQQAIKQLQANYKNLTDDQKKALNQMIENEKNFQSERRAAVSTEENRLKEEKAQAVKNAQELYKKDVDAFKQRETERVDFLKTIKDKTRQIEIQYLAEDYALKQEQIENTQNASQIISEEEQQRREQKLEALKFYEEKEKEDLRKQGASLAQIQEVSDRYILYRYNMDADLLLRQKQSKFRQERSIAQETFRLVESDRLKNQQAEFRTEKKNLQDLQDQRMRVFRGNATQRKALEERHAQDLVDLQRSQDLRQAALSQEIDDKRIEQQKTYNQRELDLINEHQQLVENGRLVNDRQSDIYTEQRKAKNEEDLKKDLDKRRGYLDKLQEQIGIYEANRNSKTLEQTAKFYELFRKKIRNEHEGLFSDFIAAEVELQQQINLGNENLEPYQKKRDELFEKILGLKTTLIKEEADKPSALIKLQNAVLQHELDIRERLARKAEALQTTLSGLGLKDTSEIAGEIEKTQRLLDSIVVSPFEDEEADEEKNRLRQRLETLKALQKEETGITQDELDKRKTIYNKYLETQNEANDREQQLLSDFTQGISMRADAISGVLGALMENTGKNTKRYKAMAIASSIIDTLSGISKAIGSGPAPWNFIQAASVAITGWANVNKIRNASTEGDGGGQNDFKPGGSKFASGGLLVGPGHNSGGIRTSFGELEGGEFVVNKRSTQRYAPLISAINMAGGGKKYATGGVLGNDTMVNDLMNEVRDQARVPLKTYVVATDMSSALEAQTKIRFKTTL